MNTTQLNESSKAIPCSKSKRFRPRDVDPRNTLRFTCWRPGFNLDSGLLKLSSTIHGRSSPNLQSGQPHRLWRDAGKRDRNFSGGDSSFAGFSGMT
jgi:hypothetical protein